jgi:hypothetical protein
MLEISTDILKDFIQGTGERRTSVVGRLEMFSAQLLLIYKPNHFHSIV